MTTHTTMPQTLQPPASSRPDTPTRGRRVTDAPTRMFHWLFALCFVGAYLTSEGESLRALHVTLGYTLAGLLAFRVLYGLFGPRQARLSVLANKISAPLLWLRQLPQALARGQVNWQPGIQLVMALAMAGMLLIVLPITASGYVMFNDLGGEWVEELHEVAGNAFLRLVLGHLALLLALSLARRKNLAMPMLTGRTPGKGPDLVRSNRAWLALLILVAALAYGSWEWQQAPHGLISTQAVLQTLSGDDDD